MIDKSPYTALDRWRFDLLLRLLKRFFKNKFIFKGSRVLDVGVGTGRESHLILSQGPGLFIGLDNNYERLNEAYGNLKVFPQANFMLGDAHVLPLKDNSLDIVLFSEALHHIISPYECLKEAIRVTRHLIILDDARKSKFRDMLDYIFRIVGVKPKYEMDEGRECTFRIDLRLLNELANKHDLELISYPFFIYTFDVWFSKERNSFIRNCYLLFIMGINKIFHRLGNRVIVFLVKKQGS